jgi:hypothetical protein
MHFQVEHRFHGSREAVAALLADPDFYVDLVLPDVGQPTVLDHRVDGDNAIVRLRYEFVGSLDPIARRVVGSSRLAWIQEVDVDSSAYTGKLSFYAEADPKRLHGSAVFVLTAQGDITVRRTEGDLVVAVPLIGSRAEKRILPGLLRRLDIEAETLDEKLRAPQ